MVLGRGILFWMRFLGRALRGVVLVGLEVEPSARFDEVPQGLGSCFEFSRVGPLVPACVESRMEQVACGIVPTEVLRNGVEAAFL